MSNIFERVIDRLAYAFDTPGHRQSQEAFVMREMYGGRGGNLVPHQWYRLLSEQGNCRGFSYVCTCGREHQMVDFFEAFRDYECPPCHDKFNLLKFVGIDPAKTPANQWKSICDAKLPARPFATTKSAAPPYLTVGEGPALGGAAADRDGWDGPLPPGAGRMGI
jgi:hypothetical protein